MKKTVALHNLGCKVNAYELEAIQQLLENRGYEIVPFAPGADVYIINTCTVTNIADRKSRQMLHKAKKMNPDAVVVACGCYVQAAGEKLEEDTAIDLIIGNNKKKDLVDILENFLAEREDGGKPSDAEFGTEAVSIPVPEGEISWIYGNGSDKLKVYGLAVAKVIV